MIDLYHVCKALSYRFLAVASTMGLVYVITGELALAGVIGGIDVGIKLVLYYMHEMVWESKIRHKFKGELK